jgi:chromosome segregation protein
LYLTKIDIFGFKSFAEKTMIEFDRGISAIVGPNGSGKSNIVDAIRWVLGEQGDKILRSEKREDVVFNGTRNRKPLSVAEVSLTVSNNEKVLPTEYSEIQIARRFFRSGDTEYYLNGTKVRLKDIRSLFVDTGIGPDAYSVMELKMVETILSSVKNERRKLFEEASGIIAYKQNRDLTINRLKTVNETLTRVNDIIKEKQRNVNALERQVKRTEEAKKVFEEVKRMEINLSLIEFKILIDDISGIKNGERQRTTLKNNLEEEIAKVDTELDSLREEINSFEQITNNLQKETASKKDSIHNSEKTILVNEQKIKNCDQNINRLLSENKTLSENTEKNEEELKINHDKIEVNKDTLLISESALEEKRRLKEESISQIGEKKTELMDIGKKLKERNKKVNDLKTLYNSNKISLENNLSQLTQISDANQKNILQINQLQTEKNDNDEKIKRANERLKKAEKELEFKKSELQIKNDAISLLEKEINNKTLEQQKIVNKILYLKNLYENLEDYSEGLKHLMTGEFSDRVASITNEIIVPEKFKIAIETALGEISNYLIINDSRNLQILIDQLRNNEKGKVTFILNDKLPKAEEKWLYEKYIPSFIDEKGVYGFANELIKFRNKEYGFLFNLLLDEYIVVDDISTAFRLSNDNYYKFITLEGDIVTESFVRAGGEIKDINIKIGRENQIASLNEHENNIKKELGALNIELSSKSNESETINIQKYEKEFTIAKNELKDLEYENSRIDFKIIETNKLISANEKYYADIQEINKQLNEDINNQIKSLNEGEAEESNLDKELSFLTNEFNEIEQKFTEHLNEFNSFNLEVMKVRNELKNEEQNYNRILQRIENQSRQIEKNKIIIGNEESKKKELEKRTNEIIYELTSLKTELEAAAQKYGEIKTIYESHKRNLNKVDSEQNERRKKFYDISQKLLNSQVKIREDEIKSEHIREILKSKYQYEIPIEMEELEQLIIVDEDFDFTIERKRLEELNERLQKLGGGFQQIIWEDFQNEKEELDKMITQRNDLVESEKDIKKTIDKINQEAREKFLKTFEAIRLNFIEIFKQLFQEGDEANLRLVYDTDEEGKIIEDPLEAKIEIIAKPRGKRPTSIELLSGGEKALTAIALLFAIYLVKPSPFCILDEVDAPLDPANLGRFNNMIRRFSKDTQFILITHNERTMESVDKLYGVTMQEDGVTTIVETKFKS